MKSKMKKRVLALVTMLMLVVGMLPANVHAEVTEGFGSASATKVTATTATIEWEWNDGQSYEVDHFCISVFSTDGEDITKDNISKGDSKYILEELSPSTTYRGNVIAMDASGHRLTDKSIIFKTNVAISFTSATYEVVSPGTSIQLNWAFEDATNTAQGFNVYYRNDNENTYTKKSLGSTENSYTITGLRTGDEYKAYIVAFDSNGLELNDTKTDFTGDTGIYIYLKDFGNVYVDDPDTSGGNLKFNWEYPNNGNITPDGFKGSLLSYEVARDMMSGNVDDADLYEMIDSAPILGNADLTSYTYSNVDITKAWVFFLVPYKEGVLTGIWDANHFAMYTPTHSVDKVEFSGVVEPQAGDTLADITDPDADSYRARIITKEGRKVSLDEHDPFLDVNWYKGDIDSSVPMNPSDEFVSGETYTAYASIMVGTYLAEFDVEAGAIPATLNGEKASGRISLANREIRGDFQVTIAREFVIEETEQVVDESITGAGDTGNGAVYTKESVEAGLPKVNVTGISDKTAMELLTTDEQDYVKAGGVATVYLDVTKKDIAKSDKDAISNALNGAIAGKGEVTGTEYMDMELKVAFSGTPTGYTGDVWPGDVRKINNTNGATIDFSVDISDELQKGATENTEYRFYGSHASGVVLHATAKGKVKTLTGKTKEFSPYAMTRVEASNAEVTPGTSGGEAATPGTSGGEAATPGTGASATTQPTSPKTGDTSTFPFAVLALLAGTTVVANRKKRV